MTVTDAGTYGVTVTDIHGCVGSDNIQVLTLPVPEPVLGNDTTVCPGEQVVLNAGGGYQAYQWSVAGSTGQTLTVDAAGTYSVEVTDNNGCTGSDTLEVSYHDLPAVKITGDTVLCEGETTTLDAGTGYQEYLWSVGTPNDNHSITTGSAGKYTVDVKDSYGCKSSDSMEVIVHPVPSGNLDDSINLCSGTMKTLDPGGNPADNYLWSDDSTTPAIVIQEGAVYWVEITNSYGCSVTDTTVVVPRQTPSVTIATTDTFITTSDTTTLTATGATSYNWWPAYQLNKTTGLSVTASPDTNTTYYVRGTNEFGCPDTAEVRILVFCNKACGSGVPFTAHSGIINTGCINNVYNNNATCSWIITPENVETIYLYISSPDSFDIKPGDVLKVYNGAGPTGKPLYTFDNDHKPSSSGVPYPIIGGSAMYLELITNSIDPGTGFQAFYSDKPVVAVENIVPDGLRIYPNPFNNKTTIEFPNPQRERYQLLLMSLTGKVVRYEYNIIEGHYELNREGIPAGVYLLVLKGRQVYRGKIVIE